MADRSEAGGIDGGGIGQNGVANAFQFRISANSVAQCTLNGAAGFSQLNQWQNLIVSFDSP